MRWLMVPAALGMLFQLSAAEFRVPPLTGRVVDAAGIFTGAELEAVTTAIQRLEQASGGQMVVAVLNDLGDKSIEEAGIALAEAWRIGHKGRDDGAILIIVPGEHRMRLEVGYGWEGVINDARAGDIIRDLAGFFRANRYADGVVYAVGKVQEFVTGQAPADMKSARKLKVGSRKMIVIPLLVFIAIALLAFGGGGASGRW